jgi:hypothetical protein
MHEASVCEEVRTQSSALAKDSATTLVAYGINQKPIRAFPKGNNIAIMKEERSEAAAERRLFFAN